MARGRTTAGGVTMALRTLAAAIALGLGACAAPPQPAAAAPAPGLSDLPDYSLDLTHTFVHWEVQHMVTSTLRGRFDRSNGSVRFDPKTQQIDVTITVDTASVNSGVPVLDGLIRNSSSMLDVATFPQATFTARRARFDGEVPRDVDGELTLRGISQPLTLHALRWKCGLNPLFMRQVCGGDFEAQIDRSSFGITHTLPFVADRVRLLIEVEAIKL
jgi:polyisoprenoid-binding protein YceI